MVVLSPSLRTELPTYQLCTPVVTLYEHKRLNFGGRRGSGGTGGGVGKGRSRDDRRDIPPLPVSADDGFKVGRVGLSLRMTIAKSFDRKKHDLTPRGCP